MKLKRKHLIAAGVLLVVAICLVAVGIQMVRSTIFPPQYRPLVYSSADKYRLDPMLVASVIFVESRYRPDAVSSKKAVGLMQIMEGTAVEMAADGGTIDFKLEMLTEPRINLDFGCRYLKQLIERFDGDIVLALAGYNAGPGNVRKWLQKAEEHHIIASQEIIARFAFKETADYVKDVGRIRKLYNLLF
jgi:peptidoglycan lytic transglycosylase